MTECSHTDGEMYDADYYYCPDCNELVDYDTGEVFVYVAPETEEYECPRGSCPKYLYGMTHKHTRYVLGE